MFCFKTRKLLVPYAEGTLGEKTAEAVTQHVSRCPKCAEELAVVRQACRAFRTAKTPSPEPRADLWARIEREIAAPAPVRAPTWRMRSLQLGGAAAAATILLLAVISVGKLGDIAGRPPIHNVKPPSVAPNSDKPKTSSPPSGAVDVRTGGDSVGDFSHVRTKPHLYYYHSPVPKTVLSELPAADGRDEKPSAPEDGVRVSGNDEFAVGDWPPPAKPSAGTPVDGGFSVLPTSRGTVYADRTDSSSSYARPSITVAAAPTADLKLDDSVRSYHGTRVASAVVADSGPAGPAPTSVDQLNDADTDTRVAALFMYP